MLHDMCPFLSAMLTDIMIFINMCMTYNYVQQHLLAHIRLLSQRLKHRIMLLPNNLKIIIKIYA